MTDRIEVLLLLSLPAAGKSVIRRFLSSLPPEIAERDFHLGPLVQLDDFPYVHLMAEVSEAMATIEREPAFFEGGNFKDLGDWATLIRLINQEYAALWTPRRLDGSPAGEWMMARLEGARAEAGMPDPFGALDAVERATVAAAIEHQAAALAVAQASREVPQSATVVIEFSRGGPEGAQFPLEAPYGYACALSHLSVEILESAAILYVRVSPEDSLRRNRERARPGANGSVLHHSVPEWVLRANYGCDDLEWLADQSKREGTITVHKRDSTFHVPVAVYDNQDELAVFGGTDPADSPSDEMDRVHTALREAFDSLARPGESELA